MLEKSAVPAGAVLAAFTGALRSAAGGGERGGARGGGGGCAPQSTPQSAAAAEAEGAHKPKSTRCTLVAVSARGPMQKFAFRLG